MSVTWSEIVIVIPTVPARRLAWCELAIALEPCLRARAGLLGSMTTGNPKEDLGAAVKRAWDTGRRYIFLTEDDAWPAPTFAEEVPEVLSLHPTSCVSFFTRREKFAAPGDHPAAPRDFGGLFGAGLPLQLMKDFPEWAPEWYAAHPQHTHAADLLFAGWLKHKKIPLIIHSPSLSQHRAGKSTFPGRAWKRTSPTFTAAFGEVPDLPPQVDPGEEP